MFNNDASGMYMPVAPAYSGGNGFGNGFLGGDGIWALLIFAMIFGGWGNGFGGGGFGGFAADGAAIYPWMNQAEITTGGFRDQMINSNIQGIQSAVTSGFGDVQTALCGGFAGVNASINNAQNALTQQMYTNQIADMDRSFAVQTQLSQCCCENRLASANLSADLAREACANRATSTANTQAILDKLCQLELDNVKTQLDAKNDRISELQTQLSMASLAASQNAQTAQLIADNTAQTQYIVNRVAPYPIPAYPVSNPYGCNCGCGCVA